MNTNWERNSSVHLQIVLQRAIKIINSKIGKDFKEKADYVDEKFEAMIVDEVLIFYGSHFTVIPLKELKEIHLYRTRTGRRVYYGIKFMFKKKRRSFIPNTYGKSLEDGYRLVRKVNYFVPVKIRDDWKNSNRK